ncbi:hypothetical protein ACFE04_022840 [Oxalis oulophora]
MRKLEHVPMQNRMFTDRIEEIRRHVYRLRATLETRERDNHFMHEAGEVALHKFSLIENENIRMTNGIIQQMNMITMLNARNQNIVMDIYQKLPRASLCSDFLHLACRKYPLLYSDFSHSAS